MTKSEFIAKPSARKCAGAQVYPVTPPWTGIKIELMEDNHLDAANNTATSRAMRDAIARAVADAAFNRYPIRQHLR